MDKKMKTVSIKGKPYVMVNERIKALRENFEGYRIITSWIKIDMEECICFAKIEDDQGNVVATGTAFELAGNNFINKTSHIENAETSAVGRALGMFGIGIDNSIATAEEVNNAVKSQGIKGDTLITKTQITILKSMIKDTDTNSTELMGHYGIESLEKMTREDFLDASQLLSQKKKVIKND